jgi:hypothetical protein
MSFFKKYLKYKIKYLSLFNQLGGWKCLLCNTDNRDENTKCTKCNYQGWTCMHCTFINFSNDKFCAVCEKQRPIGAARVLAPDGPAVRHGQRESQPKTLKLFTLGIGDPNLRLRWQQFLRPTFLQQIPRAWMGIDIRHIDPLLNAKMSRADINQFQLEEVSLDRIRSSELIGEVLDVTLLPVESCILLDMVGIFSYNSIGQVRDSSGRVHVCKSVNIGNTDFSNLLAQCNFISINDQTGVVTTYIDRMITLKYRFDVNAPYEFIRTLLDQAGIRPENYFFALQILIDTLMTQDMNPRQLVEHIRTMFP